MGTLVGAWLVVALAAAVGQDKPAKRPGLEAQLTSLGVTKATYPRLTAAVKLTNNSLAYVFVLLFGAPHAVDDAGVDFQ